MDPIEKKAKIINRMSKIKSLIRTHKLELYKLEDELTKQYNNLLKVDKEVRKYKNRVD